MRKIGFLSLFLLTLLAPALLFAQTSGLGTPTAVTSATAVVPLTQVEVENMIRPMLEQYTTHHPDATVRIWSMVILANINKLTLDQLPSLPTLLQQMSSADESIRLVAVNSISQALSLNDEQWKGIMAPILLTLAKNSSYPEVRNQAIQILGALQKMNKGQLSVLPLLFELAQNDNAEIRKIAEETIGNILTLAGKSAAEQGAAGGGGASVQSGPLGHPLVAPR